MAAIQPVPGPAEPEGNGDDEEQAKEDEHAFERALAHDVRHLYVTPALVAANLIVYGLMTLRGVDFLRPDPVDLLYWGANYGPLTQWQWWRVATSTFVHAGLIHVGLNMVALWTSARIVERLYGVGWFVVLYLSCGIGASLVSLWHHPQIPSVGASGAIVGVYGALLAFMLHPNPVLSAAARKTEIKSLAAFFAYLLLDGYRYPEIDTAAHLGGALLGFALGLAYAAWLTPRMPSAAEIAAAHESAIEPPR